MLEKSMLEKLENNRYMWVHYANHAKKQIWDALVNVNNIYTDYLNDMAIAAKGLIAQDEGVSPSDIEILDYKYFGAVGLKFIGI